MKGSAVATILALTSIGLVPGLASAATEDQCPPDLAIYGTCPQGGQIQTPALAAVSGLALSNKTFAAEGSGPPARNAKTKAPHGTKVSFELNEAATVRFTVTQRLRGRKVKRGKKTVCVK